MATRLYLTADAAAVTPADAIYTAAGTQIWEAPVTAPAVNKLARAADWPGATTFATASGTNVAAAAADVALRRFVSDPLSGAQTITGTLQGQMKMRENNIGLNAHAQIMVKVVSNDAQTLRGTLYGGDSRTGTVDEFTTTLRNQQNPAAGAGAQPGIVNVTSVSAQDGDRILVEVGYRNNSTGTSTSGELRYGSLAATGGANDYASAGTETTDLNGWVELSQTLTFGASQINVSPTGFADTESFGAESIQLGASPTGFADTESFGSPAARLGASPTGFAETEAFGAPAAQLGVSPTGFADTESFGLPAITFPPPQINVSPTGFADTEGFGSPAIQLGVAATGFADAEAFGAPAVRLGVTTIGFADAEAFGELVVRLGVAPIGFADAEASGLLTVQLNVSAIGFEDLEVFGEPGVTLAVVPIGFADTEGFGLFAVTDTSAAVPSLLLPSSGRNTMSRGPKDITSVVSDGKDTARVNR